MALTDEQFWRTGVAPATSWTIADVRAALDAHEAGDFSASASLADAMGRDSRVSACLATRVRAVAAKSGLPFHVEPSDDGDPDRAAEIAAQVERIWWDVLPESALGRLLSDGILLGVGVARLEWSDEWAPKLRPLPAHFLRWDDTRGGYVYGTSAGEVPVTPGDGGWVLYAPGGAESWLGGAVRGLGLPWIYRQQSYTDWARYCERHGIPILTVKEPASAENKEAFYARLKKLGREAIVRLPVDDEGRGFDLGIVEAKDTSWQAFEAFKQALAVDIAIRLLGQNLTTEVQGGSYAATTAHNQIRRDHLTADCESLATDLRAQVWTPWGRLTDKDWSDRLAPWGAWSVDPPEDKKASAETLRALGDALGKFATAGYELAPKSLEALAKTYGVALVRRAAPAAPSGGVAGAPDPTEEDGDDDDA